MAFDINNEKSKLQFPISVPQIYESHKITTFSIQSFWLAGSLYRNQDYGTFLRQ